MKINKSQLIRDFHLANPDAKPMQIAEALKQKKVKVTNLYVSLILSKLKNQPVNEKGEFVPAKRGRKPKAETVAVAAVPAKRGRKPKAETVAVVVAPAKRGRPKGTVVAKRGRKPADNMALLINGLRELAKKLEQQVA